MADQGTFPFLLLPPELRSEIYYLALGDHRAWSDRYGPTICSALAPPAIIRTNRQIRHETLPVYYGQNRFSITFPLPGGYDAFERWCAVMGPHFRFIKKSISFTHTHNLCSGRREDDPRRIGDGTLDVNSLYAVSLACFNTMPDQAGAVFSVVGRRAVFDKVVDAQCTVAPLCTQVSSGIYLGWSLLYISRQTMVALT
ncbi:hypothetical protein PG994_007232 [Apiospora phragmitis]|uniref:Uncharacterized protein n=1 Tax=Apiospora phragmitis TaxID=2905665 RepID=A0ABR1V3D1_9PEZI